MYSVCYLYSVSAAKRTLSASPGKENVRKTMLDVAAILAPSPESFSVMQVCGGTCAFSNFIKGKYCRCKSLCHYLPEVHVLPCVWCWEADGLNVTIE